MIGHYKSSYFRHNLYRIKSKHVRVLVFQLSMKLFNLLTFEQVFKFESQRVIETMNMKLHNLKQFHVQNSKRNVFLRN